MLLGFGFLRAHYCRKIEFLKINEKFPLGTAKKSLDTHISGGGGKLKKSEETDAGEFMPLPTCQRAKLHLLYSGLQQKICPCNPVLIPYTLP